MGKNLHEKIYRINWLTEKIDSLYHRAARELGVSDSVLFVLYMTYINKERCPLHDIYMLSGISKQTINSAIRRLENEGAIFLEKNSGKAKTVCLTEQGRRYAKQTAAKLFEAECSAFQSWSEEELSLYLTLMEKHNASLRKEIDRFGQTQQG